MHIQARHAIIAHLAIRQKGQRPAVPRAKDDVVDVQEGGAVFEIDASVAVGGADVRDGAMALDRRVAEGIVAEVGVIAVGADGGVYGWEGGVCEGEGEGEGDVRGGD